MKKFNVKRFISLMIIAIFVCTGVVSMVSCNNLTKTGGTLDGSEINATTTFDNIATQKLSKKEYEKAVGFIANPDKDYSFVWKFDFKVIENEGDKKKEKTHDVYSFSTIVTGAANSGKIDLVPIDLTLVDLSLLTIDATTGVALKNTVEANVLNNLDFATYIPVKKDVMYDSYKKAYVGHVDYEADGFKDFKLFDAELAKWDEKYTGDIIPFNVTIKFVNNAICAIKWDAKIIYPTPEGVGDDYAQKVGTIVMECLFI